MLFAQVHVRSAVLNTHAHSTTHNTQQTQHNTCIAQHMYSTHTKHNTAQHNRHTYVHAHAHRQRHTHTTQHSTTHTHSSSIVPHYFSFPHRVVSLATRSHTKESRNSTHRWQWSTSLLLWPAVATNRRACMHCGIEVQGVARFSPRVLSILEGSALLVIDRFQHWLHHGRDQSLQSAKIYKLYKMKFTKAFKQ